jgi:hypothetical protein
LHKNSSIDSVEQLKKSITNGCMDLGSILGGTHVFEDVVGGENEF